ncbi:tRNA (guanine(26)-N(2))-dimethyltransferase-like isoform X1 [Mya arenaria]|uniref:tRNA (guanine(26)-N(2))-dimethyltransferase-like isoform X1 n=1 Tax=Mya arenaria TaxID=6604 RepID=UPI0022E033D3|nr:tRNA (guanine(26)-N(2))-dimethyltransferase-like isoform X1 [Mya arenaria]XP_052805196.1 tRNA (guanine(26)-N(2))-dimethyltransferase-like isoform X1 [Mya arenaria]XP_052805197.1 tRNA (guanine(26)-N(2))-dimethyltransferase-like isoform X1 [Mya arenaria]XP_052805198.1 tRNA (guanine(26)-N(2))-dimethyltransferase-like isoform X1 [Mya arenaria]
MLITRSLRLCVLKTPSFILTPSKTVCSKVPFCSMMANEEMTTEMEGLSTKFNLITEGKATIIQPESVFYNPVQEFNRDITIAVISEFATDHIQHVKELRQKKAKAAGEIGEADGTDLDAPLEAGKHHPHGMKILEGLAASGLRSMRFGHEIPGVQKIICNDFDKQAAEIIAKNITRNGLSELVEASCADASMLMYQNRFGFDVVDLDPYGTAAPFLDSAVKSVREGGLLCITCTDAATLCGNTPEKCFTMYGSLPLRSKFCHEMAMRIILRCLESHAARHSRYIVPLISLSIDFYFRIFVKVYSGQKKAKFSATHTGMVYQCSGCGAFKTQNLAEATPAKGDNFKFSATKGPPVAEKCEHCGSRHQMGGPLYLGPLHDKDFIHRVIGRVVSEGEGFRTGKRLEGMLSTAQEELDTPLYYEADGLYQTVKCQPMPMNTFRSALLNAGYEVSYSHACKNSVKTNAPNSMIWDIMRAWVNQLELKPKRNVPGTAGFKILSEKPSVEVDFTEHPGAIPKSRSQNLIRWQVNPERNWGPKPRAKREGELDTMETRRLQNQGKRRKKAEKEADKNNSEADKDKNSDSENVS